MLKFSRYPLRLEFFTGRGFVPSIAPSSDDQTFCLRHQQLRKIAFAEIDVGEADLETTNSDLMSGQYGDPLRVVAFNIGEQRTEDTSEDVAREILRRLAFVGQEPPSSIAAFVELHLGPDRLQSLRLN